MKTIDYLPHTADIRLKLTADSFQELLEAALSGMNHILKEGECDQHREPTVKKMINLKSPDLTVLLVEFMNEVLALSHTSRSLFCRFHAERLVDGELTGFLAGIEIPGFDEDVKAVTYHEADVKMNADGKLETVIVLDI